MCTGLEIAGLVTAIAGTALSAKASSDTQSAMNNTAKQELLRQQGYSKQALPLFQQNLAASGPSATKAGLNLGTQQAQAATGAARAIPLATSQSSAIPTGFTNDGANQARAAISDRANAANQSYNAFTVQQALRNLLTNQQLGVIGQQAGQSGSVLPYELQQAQQSQAGLSGLGSLLQTGGGLLGMFGATRPIRTTFQGQPQSLLGDLNFNPNFSGNNTV